MNKCCVVYVCAAIEEVVNECDEGALRPLEGRVDSPLREVLHVKLKTDSVPGSHSHKAPQLL